MRHSAFCVLGEDASNISAALKKYVMMYGEGEANEYFKMFNWTCPSQGMHIVSELVRLESDGENFCSGLEDLFHVIPQSANELRTAEEVEHFFSVLYNKTVTVNRPGDSSSLNLFLLLPLYKPSLWNEARLIMDSIDKIPQSFNVDIIGFTDDMAYLLTSSQERELIPAEYNKLKSHVKEISKEIVEYDGRCKHRFIVMQNRTSNGISLDFNLESLTGVLGEFALVCIENYTSVFPVVLETEQREIDAIGLAVLNVDEYYFIHYLLRKAYLKVLSRENVAQREVDVNKVSLVAQQSLEGHVNIFSDFYTQEVDPLMKRGKNESEIVAEITPKLNDKIDGLAQELQAFISRDDLSLPEKQATLAQILGEDDKLLKGYQYNTKQLTIDDCDREVVGLFIEENNKTLQRSTDVDGNVTVNHSVLRSPCKEDGEVYLPIDELKSLRAKIKESSNYIRQKSLELDELDRRLQKEDRSNIRLTKDGFQYDGITYKLSNVKEKTLQEDYKATVNPKTSVDLRPNFTDIKNQGDLGTCSVFSIVSIYEYILKKTERIKDLSERFVYFNIREKSGSMDDLGSSLYDVIDSISQNGVCSEQLCRYSKKQYREKPTEDAYAEALTHKIQCAKNVKINHDDLTSALSEGYPIAISLKIYESFGHNRCGFIYRPTNEEIESDQYGNHAMVICGYSSEERVYIVRNSWGDGFGDKGYCYIPFSYIEDSNLANSAFIITAINEGEEVNGIDTPTAVSFNKTNINIRYSIIRILVEEEKVTLRAYKEQYDNLKFSYETLIQSLSNNSKRIELSETAKRKYEEDINNARAKYNSFIDNERTETLKQYKSGSQKIGFVISAITQLFIVIWFVCLANVDGWLNSEWMWIVAAVCALGGMLLGAYIPYKRHHYNLLKDELENNAQQMNLAIKRDETEMSKLQLRLYIAGMILDKLVELQKALHHKYLLLKTYVGNLSVWQEEELDKINKMAPLAKEPFLPLLSNDALEEYFEKEGEKLTGSIHLYECLNGVELSEQGIREYKTSIKNKLIEALKMPLKEFSLLSHIFNPGNNDYIKSLDMEELLPSLDRKSKCFLQSRVVDLAQERSVAKNIFIHASSQDEAKRWNNEYSHYFQNKPDTVYAVSKRKIVMLQRQGIQLKEIVI